MQPQVIRRSILSLVSLAALATAALAGAQADANRGDGGPKFSEPKRIDNPYSPLTKFDRCVMRGRSEGERERVVRRLLDRTEPFTVDGETVEVAVIKDRAFVDGELVERTLDYFGQADDGTVHYFGEHVNNYENGGLKDHSGSFRYGEDTRTLGVLMPADPQVGDWWYFEKVPGITVERDKVVDRLGDVRIDGRTYHDVIRVRESIQPEEEIEYKLYGRGVGVISERPPDGRVDLVGCS